MARTQQQIRRSFLAVVFMTSASVVSASDARENENVLTRTGAPSEDRLVIEQSDGGTNSVNVHLDDSNALLRNETWARGAMTNLGPGLIRQTGSGHVLTANFTGQDHQVAVWQSGRSHQATVSSRGRANLVSIAQAGRGNTAGVTQAGMRNSVVISQN